MREADRSVIKLVWKMVMIKKAIIKTKNSFDFINLNNLEVIESSAKVIIITFLKIKDLIFL
ncbi:MAG: hypothetical protein A2725_03130 [Candidatus Magasanikbacteria bacterium RIFCSPHIGHO2_01_FULL_33_34]|uniref:Uncharacterized protein n=1 Tax=Candidatus Magasanikbacteria bacterium RIFCSPHIGHO2_01_FULL_33_34 TaxID=1798671 RepID=A0A1F6LHA3_9BACT|nr:MAG: hypothetical protein A2725_03130 [Candidatus Magasanikbacteria bacterium RIFCSPHIGHO2_01_FULL_33_34]OGH66124.1 MAG: hypothetical protein A3B83_00620 [Candidatus Magasanikbacteria bacterium RIFCSPHIGHO2_02_FULL_33_17]OGH75970.1 MAG: hypothetical protein A3A89_00530 [Candidatus Magasanikbacteria bacterium RIFCSPLOWO2_01_FULL_33_34]OGH81973.1 MAG: hypothetical protein A3F93_02225 [Candidatus Magasanikbacteria bacterium RIFCSPLOWO2_12_FULL_34_7]